MMTVRSPNGLSIVYNSATWASRRSEGYTDLYVEQGGKWIAQVPNDWLIETVRPCRVYDATHQPEDLAEAFLDLLHERTANWSLNYTFAKIKRELQQFDATRRRWKS